MKFNRNAVERIRKVVKAVESQAISRTAGRSRFDNLHVGMWAKITAIGEDADEGRYAWIALEPNDSDGFDENDEWGEGTFESSGKNYAIEAQGRAADVDDIVWIRPSVNEEYYIFQNDDLIKVKITDEFIAEGTSATGEIVIETSETGETTAEITLDTAWPNGQSDFCGVAYQDDIVYARKIKIDDEYKYFAQGVGHVFGKYTAVEDSDAGDSTTVTTGDEISQDCEALTDWSEDDVVACWWDRGARLWVCALIGAEPAIGCGLERNEDGEIVIAVDDLVGDGLTNPRDEGYCKIDVAGGCGIVVTESGVHVNAVDFVSEGNGLKIVDAEAPCPEIEISVSCGLVDDGSGNLQVDLPTLVSEGNGLKIASGETCDTIEMSVGCGLIGDEGGNLQVDVAQLAGEGLTVIAGETCDELGVDCDFVVGCIEEELEDPESSLYNAIINVMINSPTIINYFCNECENRITCEDTEGEPVYRHNGMAWVLIDPCDCEEPDIPTEPDMMGESGDWLAGTCVTIDCEYCEGLPVYEWVSSAWTIVNDCDCVCDGCTYQEPDGSGTYEGERACGTCDITALDCMDCEGEPVFMWTDDEWVLDELCDCGEGDEIEPMASGDIEGEYQCGTCAGGATIECSPCGTAAEQFLVDLGTVTNGDPEVGCSSCGPLSGEHTLDFAEFYDSELGAYHCRWEKDLGTVCGQGLLLMLTIQSGTRYLRVYRTSDSALLREWSASDSTCDSPLTLSGSGGSFCTWASTVESAPI